MRIISGKLKGKSIFFLKNEKTRPLKDSLKENIEKKKSSADELLEKYYGPWNKDVTKIFGEYSY